MDGARECEGRVGVIPGDGRVVESRASALFTQTRDYFGALVMHVPLLHAMQEATGGSPIVYSQVPSAQVFVALGLAQEVRTPATAGWKLLRELRRRRFGMIVTLRPLSLGLNLTIRATGARHTMGFSPQLGRLLLSRSWPRDRRTYRAVHYLRIFGAVDPQSVCAASMGVLAQRAAPLEAPYGSPYCFMPCGRGRGKLWGEDHYVALARRLVERDPSARFLLVLGEREHHYPEVFASEGLAGRTRSLVEGSLADIARAVIASRVVVANDCGPSHIAQIAGVPIVSLFGNSDGRVAERIGEWFYVRPGARCLTTAEAAPIRSIPVERVLREVEALARDPRAPGSVVFLSASETSRCVGV